MGTIGSLGDFVPLCGQGIAQIANKWASPRGFAILYKTVTDMDYSVKTIDKLMLDFWYFQGKPIHTTAGPPFIGYTADKSKIETALRFLLETCKATQITNTQQEH